MLGGIVGILSGLASTFFLKSLDFVTTLRLSHPWLLFLLPIGGIIVSFLYIKFGKNSAKGNNLILEQVHKGDDEIPLRMGVLILFGTLVTHLFGGSVGREGIAVQMSGSLAETVGKLFRLDKKDRRIILMCGIAVFSGATNTPITSFILGIELFGVEGAIYFFIACIVSYLFSGHHGIYTSQRIGTSKSKILQVTKEARLASVRLDQLK